MISKDGIMLEKCYIFLPPKQKTSKRRGINDLRVKYRSHTFAYNTERPEREKVVFRMLCGVTSS